MIYHWKTQDHNKYLENMQVMLTLWDSMTHVPIAWYHKHVWNPNYSNNSIRIASSHGIKIYLDGMEQDNLVLLICYTSTYIRFI